MGVVGVEDFQACAAVNKEMKPTSPERIGGSQVVPGVRRT
jgi:hypothetical protein